MGSSAGLMDDVAQEGPDTSMRLGDEKEDFKAAAKRDGFKSLATWMKWLARKRIQEQNPSPLPSPSHPPQEEPQS
jgi:hypothetical protein